MTKAVFDESAAARFRAALSRSDLVLRESTYGDDDYVAVTPEALDVLRFELAEHGLVVVDVGRALTPVERELARTVREADDAFAQHRDTEWGSWMAGTASTRKIAARRLADAGLPMPDPHDLNRTKTD